MTPQSLLVTSAAVSRLDELAEVDLHRLPPTTTPEMRRAIRSCSPRTRKIRRVVIMLVEGLFRP